MYTNADMTLYRWTGSGYDRQVIEKVFLSYSKISTAARTGRTDSDTVIILVPASSASLSVTVGKDLIVPGKCRFEFDNASQESVSAGLRMLKTENEVITAGLLETLKKRFGTSHYTDINLADVEGRIGADCSGFLTALSGTDTTAEGYYEQCRTKGRAADLPADQVCLLFRQENGSIVHVAVYTGDGRLTEMWDGCERREFKPSQWTFYGVPAWIEQQKADKPLAAGDKVTITKELTGHNTATDAVAKRNIRNRVLPGTYYVYKVYGKAVNVSKVKGSPGS